MLDQIHIKLHYTKSPFEIQEIHRKKVRLKKHVRSNTRGACDKEACGPCGGVGSSRTSTYRHQRLFCGTCPFAVGNGRPRSVGVRDQGEIMDDDICGRHFLLGGVLFVSLLLLS
jgi:hypothetical protein